MTRQQRRTNVKSILIGVLTTAAVMLAYVTGTLERIELITLDLRFRHTNSIQSDPRIVCIDIDDDTLEVVGRWPWSRVSQAPLVSILSELGAKSILVDLNWSEQEPLGTAVRADLDMAVDPLALGSEDAEQTLPDLELWTALDDAENVYLAFERPVHDPERSDEFNAAVDALKFGDEAGARRHLLELAARRGRDTHASLDEANLGLYRRARFVAALESDPTLDEVELAKRLNVPLDGFLRKWFDRGRIVALERLARHWLDAEPGRWQSEPYELFTPLYEDLTGRPIGGDTPTRRALSLALRRVLGYEATTRRALVSLDRVQTVAHRIDGITPVYFRHARAVRRCGFVSFEPDSDGVVRRVPLLASHGENVLAQIAFALGCDELGVTPDGFAVAGRTLLLSTPAGPRESLAIQLDDRGRALIPWVPGREWIKTFTHLPADAIWSLHVTRTALKHNRERVREALWEILSDGRFADLARDRQTIEGLFDLERQIVKERYRGNLGDVRELGRMRDALETEIAEIERRVRERTAALRQAVAEGHGSGEDSPDPDLVAVEAMLQLIDDCHRANAKLREDIDSIAAQIREVVEGKFCLIGYTATSLPDMKPIPTSGSAAGVMAHANLFNGMLTGRMVREASGVANLAIAAAFGLLVTLLSTFVRPRLMALLVVFFAVSYVAIAGVIVFYNFTYWMALTPAVAAMIIPFIGIAVHRYVFIDSERRQLATALGQYTSKEIARQMAEDPELCQRAEMREVTTVFTDLKGFTPISERIGAQRTQEVLNTCLGRFTDIMLRHEGMVNKFMGDGIFVFWNPVIYPQLDHAMRACRTAVDLLTGLDELREEQKRGGGDPVFEELVLRVGIATGNAIVGPCGSEQKFDYTCIGDSVNVAARLESANKFYGTQILISHATREQVGDAFAFRPLGGVKVKGKREAVPVYELLGRAGEVPEEVLADASAFGQAVALFQQRRWKDALEAFSFCQDRRPDDLAAHNYIEATASMMMNPPDSRWTGEIELTEK